MSEICKYGGFCLKCGHQISPGESRTILLRIGKCYYCGADFQEIKGSHHIFEGKDYYIYACPICGIRVSYDHEFADALRFRQLGNPTILSKAKKCQCGEFFHYVTGGYYNYNNENYELYVCHKCGIWWLKTGKKEDDRTDE